MKNLLYLFLLVCSSLFGQDLKQDLMKPAEGKSLVYFVRSNSVGLTLNFRIYDKDVFLKALEFKEYLVYECEPGEHVFWAASDNRDFVDADLEANKVYVIDIEGQMGMLVAGVSMVPFNPNDRGNRKDLYNIIKKESKVLFKDLIADTKNNRSENIKLGLEKYKQLKEIKSGKIEVLSKNMFFENADKPN